jgi:hypothetical protein
MRTILTAVALALVLAGCAHRGPVAPEAAAPYVTRGDQVDKRNREFVARLDRDHAELKRLIELRAPALLPKLNPEPPKPAEFGYGLLPKILDSDYEQARKEADAPNQNGFSTPTYSWPRADVHYDSIIKDAEKLEKRLKLARLTSAAEISAFLDSLIREYSGVEGGQRLGERIIQYNRTWQEMISKEIPRWDQLAKQYDDLLAGRRKWEEFAQAPIGRDFFRVRHPKPGLSVLEVPMYTDIEDRGLIGRFKQLIEKFWQAEENGKTYEVRLFPHFIPVTKLYAGAKPPAKGEKIDIKKHLERFPRDGLILTTGTNNTYFDHSDQGVPYIALAPTDATEFMLAHEFGHALQLQDGYFRGYRDLKSDGYEILELIPDPHDIMCNSNRGVPRPWQLRKVMEANEKTKKKA